MDSPLFDLTHPISDLLRPARFKVYYGGRGGLKSWSFAEALVRLADEARIRVLCAREYQISIGDSVHKLLSDTITRLGLPSRFRVYEKSIRAHTGAEFIFAGLHNNTLEIKSKEGIDICWVEEGQSVTRESWGILIPTIRKAGSEIWVSFNTQDVTDATYQLFVAHPRPASIVHHINYDQNPFFAGTELEGDRQYALSLIEKAQDDSERQQAQADYDHVWLGMPRRQIQSGVLRRWTVEAFETPAKARFFHGADWGFARDPSCLVRCFIDGARLYVDQEAFGYGVELDDLPALFDQIDTARTWPIKADNARPETISKLKGVGFPITGADKWPGSIKDGIAHLNAFERIVIHPRCRHVAQEARLYSYKVDRVTGDVLPIVVDAHNHGIDALRYALDQYIQGKGRPMNISAGMLKRV